MRVFSQIVVVAVGAGLAVGGWYYWQGRADGKPAAASTARGQQVVAVDTVRAERGLVEERVESIGTARANEAIVLTAKITGHVSAIGFKEGQKVQAGDLMIEFDARQQRADVEEARATVEEIRRRVERARMLRQSGNVAEARVDELSGLYLAAQARQRSVEAKLADLRINAPFAGRVGLRQVSLGNLVQPGTAITTLDDVSKIKLEFAIPEVQLGRMKMGLPVLARSAAYPDRIFKGLVRAIDTRVDPVTRSIRINAEFDNADELLRPGMFLIVELVVERRENAVLVPEEAIVPEATRQYLMVVQNNRAKRIEVTIGERLSGKVEVLRGLAVGDEVILRGTQKARDGAPVNATPARTS